MPAFMLERRWRENKRMGRHNMMKIKIRILMATVLIMVTAGASSGQAAAQQSRSAPPYSEAVPDENTLARLVWSTMVALDNANRTETYSVLYNLGSPEFKRRNTPAQLSQNFAALRQNRVDVGRSILTSPNYYIPPQRLADGSLRLRGGFDYRPKSIRFDLVYRNIGGGWRLSAISVVEMDFNAPK